jgi:hypothetical protein
MARKHSAIINEPKPDWVLLCKAPFYCFSGRYIPSAREWGDGLHANLKEITESERWAESGLDRKWSFGSPTKEEPHAWITAMDITTHIWPGTVWVMPADKIMRLDQWNIFGTSDEMLSDQEWNAGLLDQAWNKEDPLFHEIFRDLKTAAEWHRKLLRHLFSSWERNFALAIESGAAHIMARKSSVLAPFERITWNQWQYFQVSPVPPKKGKWGDPAKPDWSRHDLISTAFGPTDERLYEIHIAPGVSRSKSDDRNRSPEELCLEWLTELIRHYPDRPPKRRDLLGQEAISKFPGLSFHGFLRCFAQVRVQTQNQNWGRPGRFPKSPQKSLQQT